MSEIDIFNHFDRPLPYYSTVPEQRWKNGSFLQLTRREKGDFLLLVDFIWQGCGSFGKDDIKPFSKYLDMTEGELEKLIGRLLTSGLLEEMHGRYVQLELREQYLKTCVNNDNMKRDPTQKEDDSCPEPF